MLVCLFDMMKEEGERYLRGRTVKYIELVRAYLGG